MESAVAKPSIVFAHGLWADGSCFSKLIPALLAEGYEVMASQHGLDSLATDVAAIKACLSRVHSPAILVGHSYGGTLITHAGTDARVAGLVYIAALAPDADETSQSLLDKFPTTPVFGHLEVTDGRVWLKQSGVAHFAGDLPEPEQKLIYATQGARACGRLIQPKGRRHGVEVQAELVCPLQRRPDGSPGSAALGLKTHASHHDRSQGVPRPHVVDARRGTRGHPQGRKRSLSPLKLIGARCQGRPPQDGLPLGRPAA